MLLRVLESRREMSPSPPDENPSEPEPSTPPMDAPTLEGLQLDKERVEQTSGPVRRYASNQPVNVDAGGETPFLRDTPFASNTPGFGGETPFFMGASDEQFDFETDDTDGIPTGLPDLLNLDDLSVPPLPRPRDAAPETCDPERAHAAPPSESDLSKRVDARVQAVIQDAVNHAVEHAITTERARAAERAKSKRAEARMMAFGVGVFMASALWGLLLALALYYEALQY